VSTRATDTHEGATVFSVAALIGRTLWLLLSTAWRRLFLWGSILAGYVRRWTRGRTWPLVSLLVKVIVVLIAIPVGLHLVQEIFVPGFRRDWGLGDPAKINDWLTVQNVALLFLLAAFLRLLLRARERVVVEGFVDYTVEDAKAVSGLSTLLVTELGRLRDLYRQVTELSVPTAVGVEHEGGFGRGKDAASFLTVSADDVTDVLKGAVASDARLEIGPAKIPIGPLLALLNRVVRGPRVVGSVHLTEAGGGPTLTAQMVGGKASATWRVDDEREPESLEERKAFLDSMVRVLACRMFAELTLGGSVRWPAVQAFNEYLRLYGDSRRTPRDRARFLKEAQAQLLRAVAEDETFDLAFYNLGVIYTQLAQTELAGERLSDDFASPAAFDREKLKNARLNAARLAFERAAEKNPTLWQAHYALAVTRFSDVPELGIDQPLSELGTNEKRARANLQAVRAHCDQAVAIHGGLVGETSVLYDLRGMAHAWLGELRKAMKNHRKAAFRAWLHLCHSEWAVRARPETDPAVVDRARANAAAALHNLALAHDRRARLPRKRGSGDDGSSVSLFARSDLLAANWIFGTAARVAGKGSAASAAAHFERGVLLQIRTRYRRGARAYREAAHVHPRNPEYAARLAAMLANDSVTMGWPRKVWWWLRRRSQADLRSEAEDELRRARGLLALPFARSVTRFAPASLGIQCDATIKAVASAQRALGNAGEATRVKKMEELREVLKSRCDKNWDKPVKGVTVLTDLRNELAAGREWERIQLDLARARLHAARKRAAWPDIETILSELIRALEKSGENLDRIVELGLLAHYARALRECGEPERALRWAAECVRRDPLSVDGRREAGRAHAAIGQYQDAIDAWNHALWLSPSDAYLHQELGMCRVRMAEKQHDAERRAAELESAEKHLAQAQELFDGEYLEGEAWTRVWRGRVALARGRVDEAVGLFAGAEYGPAGIAALLHLGEAHLIAGEHRRAENAFKRCEKGLDDAKKRGNLDSRWGDELPIRAVRSRLTRGLAEAVHLAPGDWQSQAELEAAEDELKRAYAEAKPLTGSESTRPAYEQCWALVLTSEAKLLRAKGEYREALDRVRERLRLRATRDAFFAEAELLELTLAAEGEATDADRLRIATEYAWAEVESSNGHGELVSRPSDARRLVLRAVNKRPAGL
jgi:tetratricopeptide (TPR) repeat protein